LEQVVESMQIEHQPVQEAGPGDRVGIKVVDRCRRGDRVYKLMGG
jgi:translation elongation factor EF-1alpha